MITDQNNIPIFSKTHETEFISPFINLQFSEPVEFKMELRISKPDSNTWQLKKYGFKIFKKGNELIIARELTEKTIINVPAKHELWFDKANKRIKLVGRKNNQGWIMCETHKVSVKK